ncbi:poly(U)-specific endoribonuclease-C isoform X3 [Clupea harengus]|uniref:Uridylate-specific endoribonuclease n=1 Tax=Clupea harengus TaxID=7950 RepID=A0A6P8F5H8_CLUHA|nr:poly(U)-specific endoribonuclease-C isoform X3 [Clupea harengus]
MAYGASFGTLMILLTVVQPLVNAASQNVNKELSNILNELWKLDKNRLSPGTDYTISLQGKAGCVTRGGTYAKDFASKPLFSYVDENKLSTITTYSCFMKLLDNYVMATGKAKRITPEDVTENNKFLDAILETEVMKRAHKYLVEKRQARASQRDFKTDLYEMWFRLYRDQYGRAESSGFKHVFVGETKFGREIMGLHNWVQFYMEEKNKHLDYKGYKASRNDVPDADDHVLNTQFSWHGLIKPVGSVFIGVSPEFEMAIFTILFLTSTAKSSTAVVNLDEYQLELVVYRHGRSIGTAYPKLLSSNNRHL